MATSVNANDHCLEREIDWQYGGFGSRTGPLSVGLVPNNATFRKQWSEQTYLIHGDEARAVYAYEMARNSCTLVDLPPDNLRTGFVRSKRGFNMNPYLGQTWITEPGADTKWEGEAGDGKYTISLAYNNAGVLKSIRIAISRPEGNDRTLLVVGHCLGCMLSWLVVQLRDHGLPSEHYIDPEFTHPSVPEKGEDESVCAATSACDEIVTCTGCGRNIRYVSEYQQVSVSVDENTTRGPIEWNHLLLAPRGKAVGRKGAAELVMNVRDAVLKDQDLFDGQRYGRQYTVHIQELRDDMSPIENKVNKLDSIAVPREAPLVESEGMTVHIGSARVTVNILAVILALVLSLPFLKVHAHDPGVFAVNVAMLVVSIWAVSYATLPPVFYPGSSLHDFNEGNFTSKRLDQVVNALKPWAIGQLFVSSMLKTMQNRRTMQYVLQHARVAALNGRARIEGPSARLFPVSKDSSTTELRLRENPPLALLAGKGTFTMIECFKGAGQPEDVTLLSAISFRGENCQFTVVPTRTHGWTVVGGSGKGIEFPAKSGAILGQVLGNIEQLTDPNELQFWSTYSQSMDSFDMSTLGVWRMQLRDRFILGVNEYWHGSRPDAARDDLNTKIDLWDFKAKIVDEYLDFITSGQMPDIPDHSDFWTDKLGMSSDCEDVV